MTAIETATTLAREVLRLIDLWAETDGADGCEDVREALDEIGGRGGQDPMFWFAEDLIRIDDSEDGGTAEDGGGAWLDACHTVGLLDTAPEDVVEFDCLTGRVFWTGFSSDRRLRAVLGAM